MTDYQKLKKIFNEFGIEFVDIDNGDNKRIIYLRVDNNKKIYGDLYCYTDFEFINEQFKELEIAENFYDVYHNLEDK